MRYLLATILLAGCRLGFDSAVTADGQTIDTIDAALAPATCAAHPLSDLPLSVDETPVAVRATALSSGHAVAVGTDQGWIYMMRIDAAGNHVSTHTPFAGGYSLYGMSQLADTPFVYLDTSGAGYIKILTPDWNAYATGPASGQYAIDPGQAPLPGGTTAAYGLIGGGTMSIAVFDSAGSTIGSADYSPPAVSGSFASTPSGARVVVDAGDGTCETFAIAPDGVTGPRHRFGPCERPHLTTLDELGMIVYETGPGAFALHEIPPDAAQPGNTLTLGAAASARIATVGGEVWVATDAQLYRLVAGTLIAAARSTTGPFELTPTGVFWVDGATVNQATPCLQ